MTRLRTLWNRLLAVSGIQISALGTTRLHSRSGMNKNSPGHQQMSSKLKTDAGNDI
jgi:hypothetical protein